MFVVGMRCTPSFVQIMQNLPQWFPGARVVEAHGGTFKYHLPAIKDRPLSKLFEYAFFFVPFLLPHMSHSRSSLLFYCLLCGGRAVSSKATESSSISLSTV
jgi:hypothetical protein